MAMTNQLSGFEQRLLLELRDVVRERALQSTPGASPGRRWLAPRWLPGWIVLVPVAVAVAVTVALLVGPAIVAPSSTGSSAYAVELLSDGRIHVRVAADFDEGKQLERELRQAGVRVQVITVPSHPRLIGIIEFPQHQLPPQSIEAGKGEFWIDPRRFSGTVEMLINVAAEPGEEWRQAPSVFHPEEPLGGLPCVLDGTLDTAALERYALGVGITKFSWWVLEGDPKADSRNIRWVEKRPDGEVEHAELVAPDKLRVGVRPPSVVHRYGHASRPPMNLNVHESPEPTCTPELAARWPVS